jgi:hypothetical protein
MPAKLRYGANQTITNMALVVDSYAAADIEQYLLGKQFEIVSAVFNPKVSVVMTWSGGVKPGQDKETS